MNIPGKKKLEHMLPGPGLTGKKRLEGMLPGPDEQKKRSGQLRQEMEKGDLPAMIIAALLSLWPVLLILGGLMGLLYVWVVR